jgi:hypothetical protein
MSNEGLLKAAKAFEEKKSRVNNLKLAAPGVFEFMVLPHQTNPKETLWYEQVFVHFNYRNLDKMDGSNTVYRCLGKGCPLCTDVAGRFKRKEKGAYRFKKVPSYIYYVIHNRKLHYISVSESIHTVINDEIMSMLRAGVRVLDPQNSYVISLRMEVEQNGTKKTYTNHCKISRGSLSGLEYALAEHKQAPELAKAGRIHPQAVLERVVKSVSIQQAPEVTKKEARPVSTVLISDTDPDEMSDEELQASIYSK